MSLTIGQITAEAMHLSVSSRAELAEKLVESLDFFEDDDIQRAWVTEAIQRRDEIQSGRVKTIPGEQVLAEVRQMLGQ
jgi:putative addiction module component (TIGR02574 family)